MEKLSLDEILEAVDGVLIKEGAKAEYKYVSTDTRTLEDSSIFVALKGANFNGNNYVAEASRNGAKVCIIDELKVSTKEFNKDVSIIKVLDGKEALLKLAKYYRSKLNLKIVGITGSTGKTSTKDLVAAALSSKYKVFKTKGNFNNEIGLPLMVFKLDNTYDVAVLEMGMSNFGEIHNLADVARPDIAIITNIGVSHIEYLRTRDNILKAKMEITDFFSSNNTLIINSDNDMLRKIECSNYNILRIGSENLDLDFKAEDIVLKEDTIEFRVLENREKLSSKFYVNIPGKHNVLNSLLAIACAVKLGLSYEQIINGLKSLEFTSMRLDIVKGKKFTIIDDSYNASPDSMKAALDVLINFKGNKKIAVLGTMKELGKEAHSLHKEVGQYAKQKGIDIFIAVGEYSKAFLEGFEQDKKFFSFTNNEDASEYLNTILNEGDIVLIKASRSMKFETIVNKLKTINS